MSVFRIRAMAIFYRNLATLVGSGVAVIEAMGIISSKGGGPGYVKHIAMKIKEYLMQGDSLGAAFGKFPDFFPQWHVSIIKYSEAAGRLAENLGYLASYLERDYATLQRIAVGLAYPVVLLHAAFFLLPIINMATCAGKGGYISGLLSLVLPVYGIAFLLYFLIRMLNSAVLKEYFDRIILFIPVFGNIARQFALTRFIRALQCLCSSGVAIISAWKMAAEACGNSAVKEMVFRGVPVLEGGQEISKAFMQADILGADMIGMVSSAERSGSISGMLNTVATYCEKRNETTIGILLGVIPVFFYLAVAGFIAFRIITFYLGYFNQISSMF